MAETTTGSFRIVDDALMDQVRDQARGSQRRRAVHRFHRYEEPVQRMLNAIEPESYVRPHKHESPDKIEAFLALRGRAAVVIFEADGAVREVVLIAARGGTRGVEIGPRTYHSVISLESGTVLFEIGEGPYQPETHKHWAPWAPEEGTSEGNAYLDGLRKSLAI